LTFQNFDWNVAPKMRPPRWPQLLESAAKAQFNKFRKAVKFQAKKYLKATTKEVLWRALIANKDMRFEEK
jgi:hypothetical protein